MVVLKSLLSKLKSPHKPESILGYNTAKSSFISIFSFMLLAFLMYERIFFLHGVKRWCLFSTLDMQFENNILQFFWLVWIPPDVMITLSKQWFDKESYCTSSSGMKQNCAEIIFHFCHQLLFSAKSNLQEYHSLPVLYQIHIPLECINWFIQLGKKARNFRSPGDFTQFHMLK